METERVHDSRTVGVYYVVEVHMHYYLPSLISLTFMLFEQERTKRAAERRLMMPRWELVGANAN
jgi:hypothetical protein